MLKKRTQKISVFLLFLVLLGVYFSSEATIKDWLFERYLGQGETCSYHFGSEKNGRSDLPKNSCQYDGNWGDYELSAEMNSLLTKIVEQDFSGYRQVEGWISLRDTYTPTIRTEMVQRNPLIKAVWPCSYPEVQKLTTSTIILALCSVTPELQINQYSSSVTIYELRTLGSGFVSRRLYHEGPVSSNHQSTDVFHSVSYPLLNEKLAIAITKHELLKDVESRVESKLLLPWGKRFMPVYNFYGAYDWHFPTPEKKSEDGGKALVVE